MAVFYNFRFARRSNFAGSNSKKYVDMKKLEIFTRKWQFFALLLLAQCLLVPFASRNFSWQDISAIVYTTLGRSFQMSLGRIPYLCVCQLLVLYVFAESCSY